MKTEINYKELESCNVLVVGGGVAGVAAAVSASRAGAKTILVEKNTFLGGMATGGLVTPMMKNALDAKNILTKGIFIEICDRIVKADGGATFEDGNPGWFNPEIYKIILDEICTESGVKLLFDTQITYVKKENNILNEIIIFNKEGFSSIKAKEFIDATGDGDLMRLSGVSFESNEHQAMSLRFMMSGVDINDFAKWLEENDHSDDSPVYRLNNGDILLTSAFTYEKDWTLRPFFEDAIKNGDLTKEDANYFQIFSVPGAYDLIAFNCPRIHSVIASEHSERSNPERNTLDPLKAEDISYVLIQGRQMIKRISKFCKKYLPGFRKSYICQIAPLVGIRESRRLIGQYVLTKEDVVSGGKFEDAIADSNWPIDIHSLKLKAQTSNLKAPKVGDYYQIPLRSLLPKENEVKNLIVVGRCLSATFEAQGSARIQANCIAMGEAAGNFAAKRIKQGIELRT
ncbi:MAG: FAD-dependent oxidoreductase [Candidatus Melainabacteria bacterium]|nr:FAD-dependent oxidoreductase [Candidatus Melainabacteria bacterium]